MKVKIPFYARPTHLYIDEKGYEFTGRFDPDEPIADGAFNSFYYLKRDNRTWNQIPIKINRYYASLLPIRDPYENLMGTDKEVEAKTARIPELDLNRYRYGIRAGVIRPNSGQGVGKLQRELDRVGFKYHDVDLLGNFIDIPDQHSEPDTSE